MLGDLNGWIRDRMGAGIPGAFVVPRKNDNERRVEEFCGERGLCVSNSYFEHKNLRKYTWVARGQEGVEAKNMIDLMLLKNDMLCYVQDVRAEREIGRCLTVHHECVKSSW